MLTDIQLRILYPYTNIKNETLKIYYYAFCFEWIWNSVFHIKGKVKPRLRVFENEVIKRIFLHNKEDATGEPRKVGLC